MCLFNKYSHSFGLIVFTAENKVVLIRRFIPYCLQAYAMRLKKKPFDIEDKFQKEIYPTLNILLKVDYLRYIMKQNFEDEFDFPRGQMRKSHKYNLYNIFLTAYREFKEETGYSFSFKKKDVYTFPIKTICFNGLDGFHYIQKYFIINVDKLQENIIEDKDFHYPILLDVKIAKSILCHQQLIKKDNKHLLL